MDQQAWIQFRSQLFKKIEERRSKVASFKFEQMYFFIGRCLKLFGAPGTVEARGAVDAIIDEGTFLLVADSLIDFHALFPAAEAREDANPQPALRPSANRDVVRPMPEAQQTAAQKTTPQSPVRS